MHLHSLTLSVCFIGLLQGTQLFKRVSTDAYMHILGYNSSEAKTIYEWAILCWGQLFMTEIPPLQLYTKLGKNQGDGELNWNRTAI